MNASTKNGDGLLQMGWLIQIMGWMICIGSIFFALGNKSADPPYIIPFWACFATLVGVSVTYLIARRVSKQWQSKSVRTCFGPYIVGATVWLFLFVTFFVLDRILNS
jgi:hypothetical protein